MNQKIRIVLIFFLLVCGTFYFIFSRWVNENGLLSPEAYFFSFSTHGNPEDYIKNLFLAYPVLPSTIAFLYPSAPFIIAGTGILITILSLPWLFPAEPLLLGLFLLTLFASPLFFSSLSTTPTFLLFFTFLLSSFFRFLRYQEEKTPYHLFLGGILFGITFLMHPHAGWFTIPIIVSTLFLFSGTITQKFSLLMVILFPGLTFLGIIAFLNWVYTGNALSFLHSSHSFCPYLPSFSWTNWKYTLTQFPRWAVFLGPLIVGTFREKKRLFWGAVVIAGSTALPFFLPLLATLLTLAAGFLKTPSPGKIRRFVLSLSLGISFVTGWALFFLSPTQFFSFPPYKPLQEKLIEYREIASFLDTPTGVLVLDRDYFLTASWPGYLTVIIPKSSFSQTTPVQFYDYIIQPAETPGVFPDSREIFRGKKLRLYQKEKVQPNLP